MEKGPTASGISTSRGFSLIELTVVIGLIAIVGSFGVSRLLVGIGRPANVDMSSKEIVGKLRLARMLSIANDSHYQVKVTGVSAYEIQELTKNVAGIWVDQPSSDRRPSKLPAGVTFTGPNAVGTRAEFDARGLLVWPVTGATLNVQDVAVRVATGVKVLPSGQIMRIGGTVY